MKQPVWHMFGLASVVILAGCSSTGVGVAEDDSVFRNKALDYSKAPSVERLQIPADMQDKRIQNDLLVIPTVDTSASEAGILDAPRPDFVFAEMGNTTAQLFGANESKHIAVSGDMETVWHNVSQFWQLQNMPLVVADTGTGIMETAWVALPGVDADPGIVGGWLRSLTGGDNNLAYSKVRTEMVQDAAGRIAINLDYIQATHEEVANNWQPDWQAQGHHVEAKSALMFELLQYLSRTVRVAKKSSQQNTSNTGLIGKDQHGRPLLSIAASQEQAMTILLQAMEAMDVGSYDLQAGKIYFTHTTHIQATPEATAEGGVWGWFKGLHSGNSKQDTGPITLDMSVLGGQQETAVAKPAIVYSSQNITPSVSDDPKQRKGFKIWMGGEVIYIFEDEDQGDVDEQGVYTYTGNYQLILTPTLKGVYVQVLTSTEAYAAKAHAEEILWHIKQGL
ncbi:MAG: outer membrane protein assembly factor BamC [Gammaproteobacteria bacterium]|jgi:uncharacterized lipoprotein|nr:outer membrane protein assembly factor BamC [Gammaproteobacteria bacterium]